MQQHAQAVESVRSDESCGHQLPYRLFCIRLRQRARIAQFVEECSAAPLQPGEHAGAAFAECRLVATAVRLQIAHYQPGVEILAEEEPLTLTEIAQRLHRTPGSTKDYLSWLEDVDLVTSRQKRYSFADPLLRLWVRLHCRPVPPGVDDVAREVQSYAVARLPQPEPTLALAGAGAGGDRKPWGIIEID